jgi:hypothetical protein
MKNCMAPDPNLTRHLLSDPVAQLLVRGKADVTFASPRPLR